jgi:hypothetical protein
LFLYTAGVVSRASSYLLISGRLLNHLLEKEEQLEGLLVLQNDDDELHPLLNHSLAAKLLLLLLLLLLPLLFLQKKQPRRKLVKLQLYKKSI